MEEKDKFKKLQQGIKLLRELLIQKDIKDLMDEVYLEYAAMNFSRLYDLF
jgi:hypothetical protein